MNYCTITPDRGDRPELFKHCLDQLKRMNGGYHVSNAYIMNAKPKNDSVDLVPRIREGVEMAKRDGFEYVFIVESDDWYPKDYLTRQTLDFDFFGYSDTTYYNLRNKTYATFKHPDRSSLFTTAFKISALEGFSWPPDDTIFLDIKIWDFANRKKKRIRLEKNNPCLGAKHGIGKTGGKAHKMAMKNIDKDYSFLKSKVGEDFEFYKNLTL